MKIPFERVVDCGPCSSGLCRAARAVCDDDDNVSGISRYIDDNDIGWATNQGLIPLRAVMELRRAREAAGVTPVYGEILWCEGVVNGARRSPKVEAAVLARLYPNGYDVAPCSEAEWDRFDRERDGGPTAGLSDVFYVHDQTFEFDRTPWDFLRPPVSIRRVSKGSNLYDCEELGLKGVRLRDIAAVFLAALPSKPNFDEAPTRGMPLLVSYADLDTVASLAFPGTHVTKDGDGLVRAGAWGFRRRADDDAVEAYYFGRLMGVTPAGREIPWRKWQAEAEIPADAVTEV